MFCYSQTGLKDLQMSVLLYYDSDKSGLLQRSPLDKLNNSYLIISPASGISSEKILISLSLHRRVSCLLAAVRQAKIISLFYQQHFFDFCIWTGRYPVNVCTACSIAAVKFYRMYSCFFFPIYNCSNKLTK